MQPPQSIEEIKAGLETTEKGGVRQSIRNCLTVFQRDPLLSGAIAYNILTDRKDIIKPIGFHRESTALTDTDMKYLLLYLEETYGLTSEKKIETAIGIVANENKYHPIRDFLNSLAWDGTERIRFCLRHFLGADVDDYTYEALKLFMLGAITRAFKPGSKVKQEDKPDYSYWSDTLEMRRTKISTPERKEEDSPAVSDTDSRRDMDTPEYVRAADTEETGKPFRMRVEQPDAQTLPDQKERKKEFNTEMDIQALLKQLNELTGMQSVKTEINNMINLLKICKIRQENGLQTPPVTNHMVFLGNPGTGKTTVARILAKIYHGLGVLSKGHLVEVDRSGLVAGYMGQTSEKVTEVIEKAKGGILFIDEAYALANGQQGDFGQEAIDILNKAMEDNREDLIVIAAGYHDEMQDFLDANPGLRSRFNRTIEFPNYDAEELLEIMTNRAKSLDYTLTDDAVQYVQDTFTRILACPPENFGNARSVRNYLDRVIHNQANRLIAENNFKEEDLTKLTLADVQSETLE